MFLTPLFLTPAGVFFVCGMTNPSLSCYQSSLGPGGVQVELQIRSLSESSEKTQGSRLALQASV